MRLLADENIDLSVVAALRDVGHEVNSVSGMEPGIVDEIVLERANERSAMLITEDKDFGELAFRRNLLHQGVILVRLAGLSVEEKGKTLSAVLEDHAEKLPGTFTVVSPGAIRIRARESD